MVNFKHSLIITLLIGMFSPKSSTSQILAESKETEIVIPLKRIPGIGPGGLASTVIMKRDRFLESIGDTSRAAVKNKPQNLSSIVEYLFVVDNFQFLFQNYREGIYEKEVFLELLLKYKLNLADTLKLSEEPIKCYFSVLAGKNIEGQFLYIIDANNNNDFGDDVLRPLTRISNKEDQVLSSAVTVQINSFSGEQINTENILVLPELRNPETLELSFMFPEFKYNRFSYKGQDFIICMDALSHKDGVYFLSDRPRFISPGSEKLISVGQHIQIGDDVLRLASFSPDRNNVRLKGNAKYLFVGKKIEKKTVEKKANISNIVSTQIGFKAPLIKGQLINLTQSSDSSISTDSLRGKYVLLDFWSTYCGPCFREFPYLNEAYKQFNRNQFEIIGVLDERNSGLTPTLMEKHNISWPTIKANVKGTEMSGYKVSSYPTSYLIDPEGVIVAVDLRGDELVNKLSLLLVNSNDKK